MENNEISMFMDVKIDLNERKAEALLLRNWTKCLVKIEAIKCFPCYVRITFIRNIEDESANLCVRINIPGLSIRLAKSRTKTHSYGLFWNQNRKRCCIFVAFDSQLSCERHMRWMKKSIKNLELHRQEILESKRIINNKLNETESLLEFSRELEQTRNLKDLQDMLGPLPKIPDFAESCNWSRRVSGMSGIYEEIPDGELSTKRVSRGSVASGIYEEMKLPTNFETIKESKENVTKAPPPLPPRKRINTFQTEAGCIPRSYTNPETDLAKKKKYLTLLENMFGRSKRSGSVYEGKVSQTIDLLDSPDKQVYANTVMPRTRRKKLIPDLHNKRNSFSTPDLTNPNQFDHFDGLDDASSLSSEAKVFDSDDYTASNEFINMNTSSPITDNDLILSINNLNVSESIQPNFNFSCNTSTVNLVGANMNTIIQNTPKVLDDDLSGYCTMVPIKKEHKTSSDSDKENEDISKMEETIYENMIASLPITIDSSTNQQILSTNLYQNVPINISKDTLNDSSSQNLLKNSDDILKTPRKSMSIDDKIPSYYPNQCDTTPKSHRRKSNSVSDNSSVRHLISVKLSHRENLYISSPQKILDQRRKLFDTTKTVTTTTTTTTAEQQKITKLRAFKISSNTYSVVKNDNELQVNDVINIETTENNEHDMNTKNDDRSPRIYQKYATLARLSPNKYLEKCAKKTGDFGAVRKFASLPRFKKIDFSPLKIKINNVLQRHHPEGL